MSDRPDYGAFDNFMRALGRLAERWLRRFWALPWRRKGPVLGVLGALVMMAVIGAAASGSGGAGKAQPAALAKAATSVTATSKAKVAASPTAKPSAAPSDTPTPKPSAAPSETPTPKPTRTPTPVPPPTATPTPLSFEEQIAKSYRDNRSFMDETPTQNLQVGFEPSTGEVAIVLYISGDTPSAGTLMDLASAAGIVASKAIWTTYPQVQTISVAIQADYLEKATGASTKQFAVITKVSRATGSEFVYDGLKNLAYQDNKLFLCDADHYAILPAVYFELVDPGCLLQWGGVK